MEKVSIRDMCRQLFDQMGTDLQERCKPEDHMFALHPDEDHIIVSHALFLMMSKLLANRLPSLKSLYLLRKYEEEMLAAYLTEPRISTSCYAIAISYMRCFPTNWLRRHTMQPFPTKSGNCRQSER